MKQRAAQKAARPRKPQGVAKDGQKAKANQRATAAGARPSKARQGEIVDKPALEAKTHSEPRRKKGGHKAEKTPWPKMSYDEVMETPEALKPQRKNNIPMTPAAFEEICQRLATGETLSRICRSEHLPSYTTTVSYVEKASEPGVAERFRRARSMMIESWADQVIDCADDSSGDFKDRVRRDGEIERVFDPENVHRSRLRVDARKWLLARLKPEKYGESSRLEVTGKDGGAIEINGGDSVGLLNAARLVAFRLRRGLDAAGELGMDEAAVLELPAIEKEKANVTG